MPVRRRKITREEKQKSEGTPPANRNRQQEMGREERKVENNESSSEDISAPLKKDRNRFGERGFSRREKMPRRTIKGTHFSPPRRSQTGATAKIKKGCTRRELSHFWLENT